jgi:hypothetical protein
MEKSTQSRNGTDAEKTERIQMSEVLRPCFRYSAGEIMTSALLFIAHQARRRSRLSR